MAFCDGGYTTNLPMADVTGGQAWLAFGYKGRPGFWETYGYHLYGDPWREQRYAND